MPAATPARRDVAVLTLPAWLWGNQPGGLLDASHLHHRRGGDVYKVQTREQYMRRPRPALVESGAVESHTGVGAARHTLVAIADETLEPAIHAEAIARFSAERTAQATTLAGAVHHIQSTISVTAGSDLPEQVTAAVSSLRQVPGTDSDPLPFAGASAHYVRRHRALLHRVRLASLLLRLEHDRDPGLATGDTTALQAELDAGSNVLASSASLYEGVHLLDAYLTPLLAALSPTVWAFATYRVHGAILFTYGRPIRGTAPAHAPAELLDTLATDTGRHHARSTRPRPATQFTDPGAPEAAIHWWAERLDVLFGVTADPTTHTTTDGQYSPTAALHALLSVEQVFRRTSSALLAHRDTHARRAATFTTLDTISSLTGVTLEVLFDHAHATKTLASVTQHIPASAAEILLPAAHRAVDALVHVQDGFFLRAPDGTVTIAGRPLTPARAAAQYLDTLRDATHGFSTVRSNSQQRAKNSDLLAVHDGTVPHDVGLLTWLYLLDLLLRPDRLRRILRNDARR